MSVDNITELKQAIREAAGWYATLESEFAQDEDRHNFKLWLGQSALHQQAWQKVEAIQGKLNVIPARIAEPVLQQCDQSRRAFIQKLAMLALLSPAIWLAYQTRPWHRWTADYRAGVGQQKAFTLPDGSELLLNTDTAVNLHFDQQRRVLQLVRGEVLISTTKNTAELRPFLVTTSQGTVEALGTRFMMQELPEATRVSVLEDKVRIQPGRAPELKRVLQAGEQVDFNAHRIQATQTLATGADAWQHGSLVVVDRPLQDVLTELSRYRHGFIVCDERIKQLKISGAFPVNNIDQSLEALTASFPVRQNRLTPYWIQIVPN